MISNEYYSAYPAGENAAVLSQEYRKLLITNLVGYLENLQNSLGLDILSIINKYRHLDTRRNISPVLFNLFSKLVYCCNQGDVPPLIEIIHRLNILTEREIFDSEFRLTTILTENWEDEFVNKLRSDHFPNKLGDKTLILPIITSDLSAFENTFSSLTKQIKQIDSAFYQEMSTYVTRLKLFNGKAIRGATSASVFGAIYLRLPETNETTDVYFADHIIHETSHLHLDILLAFDQIVLNEDTEKFKAPIRLDPRPMFGIFHATFVLSRMVRIFQRIMKDTPKKGYLEKLDTFRKQFDQGLETIEKSAVLTENGQRIKSTFIKAAEV